jgi:type IV secretory pathway component VirB8
MGVSAVPTETLVEVQARNTILVSQVKSLTEEKRTRTIVAITATVGMFFSLLIALVLIMKYHDESKNVHMALVDQRTGEGIPITLARGPRTESEKVIRTSLEIFAKRCFEYVLSAFEQRRLLCSSMVPKNKREEILSQFFSQDGEKYPRNYRELYGEKGSAHISITDVRFIRQDSAHIEYTLLEVLANGSKQERTMAAEIEFRFHIGEIDRMIANMNAFGFLVTSLQIAQRATPEATKK